MVFGSEEDSAGEDRNDLEMIVAVPWRKNEDDPELNGA